MLAHDAIEGGEQGAKPFYAHVWQARVPVAALPIERMGATLDGIDLEVAIEAGGLGGCAQERQQRVRHRDQQQQPVTSVGSTNVRRLQSHAEAQVLGVSEGLLNREPSAVSLDDLR